MWDIANFSQTLGLKLHPRARGDRGVGKISDPIRFPLPLGGSTATDKPPNRRSRGRLTGHYLDRAVRTFQSVSYIRDTLFFRFVQTVAVARSKYI